MSRYDYYGYFPPSKPRETDQGIKAKSKRGQFTKNWWANRWIKSLENLMDAGRLRRGKRYARQGQVLSIEEKKGGIRAKVQGSRRAPYKVSLKLDHFTDKQWNKIIDALADQAIFTAQLLAGEMPEDIEDAFRAAGVSLFPETEVELVTECSCPDWANPCKHVASVHYILGEQFDEDPFMLFRLRGRTQEQIMDALSARRAEEAGPEEAAEAESVIPLEEQLDHFWEMQQPLATFKTHIKAPVTDTPILKRLGQPTFLNVDLIKLLGPAYQTITRAAINTAYGSESDNGSEPEQEDD